MNIPRALMSLVRDPVGLEPLEWQGGHLVNGSSRTGMEPTIG
jgi:hypothetical protein